MSTPVYLLSLLFWLYIFVMGDTYLGFVMIIFLTSYYRQTHGYVAPIVAPKPIKASQGSCDCLSHRLLGRVKMAA